MKVLHVYKDFFPPVVGGIERHVSLMCRFQRDQADVEALVCSGRMSGGWRDVGGIQVREVGEWGRFQGAPISPAFPLRMRQAHADVVVVQSPNPTGEISALLTRPNILVARYQSDVVRQSSAMKIYGPIFERYLDRAKAIVASSEQYIDTSPFLSVRKGRCHVIPLGIVPELYDRPSADRVQALLERYGGRFVFACGRHVYYKGFEYLVEAAKLIGAKVIIGGTGPLTKELEAQSRRTNAGVIFTGMLSEAALIDHLHACTLFVFPSVERSEAFGVGILEAQASAKPVVATRLGTGVEHVNLDGLTGVNVKPRDPEALAAAVNRLLNDATLAAEMGAAGRERVAREFDARAVAQQELNLYKSLL